MTRVLLIAALLCCAGAASARAQGLPPLQTFTLGNGLRVVLAPDPDAATADVSVYYAAGGNWERPAQAGISFLYERLMSRASRRYALGEYRRRLEAQGASYSSSAGPDGAVSWQTFPPEALDQVLQLEADRMAGAVVDAAALEAEKAAARQERRARFSRGVPRGLQRLYAQLFPGHPYGRGVDDGAGFEGITVRDVATWARARFAPNTATLIVSGRFDPEGAAIRIRRLYGTIPGRGNPSAPKPALAAAVRETPAIEPGESLVPVVIAGWRGPGAGDPDAPACEIIARMLAGTSASRLTRSLMRDTLVAASVHAAYDQRRDASVLWALAYVRPDADSAFVARTLMADVRRLAAAAPDSDEVERARRSLLLAEYLSWQSPRLRAEALGEALLERGDVGAADARLAALHAVTPADVQRAAGRFLEGQPNATVWLTAARREGVR